MKKLKADEVLELEELAKMEAGLINKGFAKSELLGLALLKNSLTSFERNYLVPLYGEIVLSFSSEYRVLVVEILKNIEKEYHDAALKELIIPTIGSLTDEEMFSLLESA